VGIKPTRIGATVVLWSCRTGIVTAPVQIQPHSITPELPAVPQKHNVLLTILDCRSVAECRDIKIGERSEIVNDEYTTQYVTLTHTVTVSPVTTDFAAL